MIRAFLAWLRGKPSPKLLEAARRIRAEDLARITVEAAMKDMRKECEDDDKVRKEILLFNECAIIRVTNLLLELQSGAAILNPNREQMSRARNMLWCK